MALSINGAKAPFMAPARSQERAKQQGQTSALANLLSEIKNCTTGVLSAKTRRKTDEHAVSPPKSAKGAFVP